MEGLYQCWHEDPPVITSFSWKDPHGRRSPPVEGLWCWKMTLPVGGPSCCGCLFSSFPWGFISMACPVNSLKALFLFRFANIDSSHGTFYQHWSPTRTKLNLLLILDIHCTCFNSYILDIVNVLTCSSRSSMVSKILRVSILGHFASVNVLCESIFPFLSKCPDQPLTGSYFITIKSNTWSTQSAMSKAVCSLWATMTKRTMNNFAIFVSFSSNIWVYCLQVSAHCFLQ